jgi:uncharacterized protein with ParB-like and HNH nuclease domain
LLATRTLSTGTKEFEILDGMQRLNALFSFIENRFSVDGLYFDVQQLARASQLSEQGEFEAMKEQCRLPSRMRLTCQA